MVKTAAEHTHVHMRGHVCKLRQTSIEEDTLRSGALGTASLLRQLGRQL